MQISVCIKWFLIINNYQKWGIMSLTQEIVQNLGIAIVTGKYENEIFPTESVLCKQYSASRTVTREAVKMLTAKGLLSARPRQGTKVEPEKNWNLLDPDVLKWLLERKFSIDLLIEFTLIRKAIEPMAAALAATNASEADKASIQKAIDRMYAAERGEDDTLSADIAFHSSVLEATGNRFYKQLQELIETALLFSIRKTNDLAGVRLSDSNEHAATAKAIIDGDAKKAQELMYGMIDSALTLMLNSREANRK